LSKQSRSYLPATLAAVEALGAQVAAARRELGWTAADLAGRLGVSAALVTRMEKGAPGTAIGTVLEAAVVCGVPLFGVDAPGLAMIAERNRATLALLPQRVRTSAAEISNDF
jgi:transcriptional regulator with XRE-family HTH domain